MWYSKKKYYIIGLVYDRGDIMNNKGFVLVESIVTSVFVLGLFTFLIANVLPLIAEYDKSSYYDSIDSIYDAHMIRKMILKNPDQRIANLVSLPDKGYYIFDGTDICLYLSNPNYCKKLLSRDFLDVKKIIVTDYEISDDFVKASKGFDRLTREYISKMQRYNNTGYFGDNRRLIIAFNDGRVTNIELMVDGVGVPTC